RPVAVGSTFVSFCVGLAIFRCQTLADGATVLGRMFWPTAGVGFEPSGALVVLLAVGAVFVGHLVGGLGGFAALARRLPAPALGTALAVLLLLALLLLPESGQAFIYFQF